MYAICISSFNLSDEKYEHFYIALFGRMLNSKCAFPYKTFIGVEIKIHLTTLIYDVILTTFIVVAVTPSNSYG